MLRRLAAVMPLTAVVPLAVVPPVGVVAFGGQPSSADQSCQRTVVINSEVTVSERTGRLNLAVYSGGCAAAGSVAYRVTAGSATPVVDFALPVGTIQWAAGDMTTRAITATVVPDAVVEPDFEDFTVTLVNPSPDVRVADAVGHARIVDDDTPGLRWGIDNVKCPDTPVQVIPDTTALWLTTEPHWMCGLGQGAVVIFVDEPVSQLTAFHWDTQDGTAKAGVDFVGVANAVEFLPAGADHVELTLQLLPRPPGTPSRWLNVRITSVSSGSIADSVALLTLPAT